MQVIASLVNSNTNILDGINMHYINNQGKKIFYRLKLTELDKKMRKSKMEANKAKDENSRQKSFEAFNTLFDFCSETDTYIFKA